LLARIANSGRASSWYPIPKVALKMAIMIGGRIYAKPLAV
jgi:hypothetical protein